MKTKKLINNLLEYEYFLIKILNPKEKETHKIKFDSKKEFNHIKRITDKVFFNDVEGFNNLNFQYNDNYIYLNLKE